jgi:deazaflavin-dependent oxidoreductase (nitroreductase family)
MPIPHLVARLNRDVLNPVMRHLAGLGPFVELEHVGRRTGRVRRTTLMAFRDGDAVTIALTYGRELDWLRNVQAAGGCRMHVGRRLVVLGVPQFLAPEVGSARMPIGPRQLLPVMGVQEFVELPVLSEARFRGWGRVRAAS